MTGKDQENQSPLGPSGPSPFGSGGPNVTRADQFNPGLIPGVPGTLGVSPLGTGAESAMGLSPDCTGALESLHPYLDSTLRADRRMLIAGHLNICPPCFNAYNYEAGLRGVVAAKCRDQVPETLRNKIREAILEDSGDQ